jgi:hypothetical protein
LGLNVEGESLLAVSYGISQAAVGVASGHLSECLGIFQPRFPLRPLWIGCFEEVAVAPGVRLTVPTCVRNLVHSVPIGEFPFALFCRRIIELGYNAVLLGSRDTFSTTTITEQELDLQSVCSQFHDYGIQVIIKPNLVSYDSSKHPGYCPLNPFYREWVLSRLKTLVQKAPAMDFLFWESCYLHPDFTRHPKACDATLAELVSAEVNLIEEALNDSKSLIYFLPVSDPLVAEQQAAWMPRLCDDVGNRTFVAFSAVAGNFYADHLPPHPFWEQLRQSPDTSATPLLPIVNIGHVLQGEGLWPSPALDLLEKYYSRLYRHRFAGAIALVNHLPQKGGMLDCSLWTAAQSLWKALPPILLAQTWFRAHRSEWGFHLCCDALKNVREIVVELSMLRFLTNELRRDSISIEECRMMTESLLARLKCLKTHAEKKERKRREKGEHPSFEDYLNIFIRDAQRIVLYFLQCFNLSYPYAINNEEHQESFWMHMQPGSGQGIRSAAKVSFLDNPNRGLPGSRMESIFLENRLLLESAILTY